MLLGCLNFTAWLVVLIEGVILRFITEDVLLVLNSNISPVKTQAFDRIVSGVTCYKRNVYYMAIFCFHEKSLWGTQRNA